MHVHREMDSQFVDMEREWLTSQEDEGELDLMNEISEDLKSRIEGFEAKVEAFEIKMEEALDRLEREVHVVGYGRRRDRKRRT